LGGLIDYYQGEFYASYGKLDRAVQENRPQVTNIEGSDTDVFSAAEKEPPLQRQFLEAMHRLGVWEGERLAQLFPFRHVARLMDVGGGSGALSIALAQRHHHLSIRILDRPSVCLIAREFVAKAHLEKRIAVVPGDFWQEPLPGGMDAILLSMVLHDWSLDKNRVLLKQCYDALPSGGHVLIFEQLLQEDRCGPLITCLTSLTMLLRTESGTEYTENDYRSLLNETGFRDFKVVQTPGLRQLLHAVKP
jgi:SAM-dependent methyltransferase